MHSRHRTLIFSGGFTKKDSGAAGGILRSGAGGGGDAIYCAADRRVVQVRCTFAHKVTQGTAACSTSCERGDVGAARVYGAVLRRDSMSDVMSLPLVNVCGIML